MGNIIRFKNEAQTMEEFMEQTANIVADGKPICAVMAFKLETGEWMTGYFGADFGTKAEALGHINADIIEQMIKSNMDKYVEYV